MIFPLVTARLVIAPMTPADAPDLAAYRSEPAVARYQSWTAPYPLHQAERLLAANPSDWPGPDGWVQLALREDGVLRGDVAVHPHADPRTVEFGVTLAGDAQGRGLATEALQAVLDAAFAAGADRVVAHCDARNAPVARLLARLGLRRVRSEAEWDETGPDGPAWITLDLWVREAGP